jgi:hypothetical protein
LKDLGRFVIRPRADGKGDLILGALAQSQGSHLKPGVVYEFREILDSLLIVEIGSAAIAREREKNFPVSWANDINTILETGKYHLLTKGEYTALLLKELGEAS